MFAPIMPNDGGEIKVFPRVVGSLSTENPCPLSGFYWLDLQQSDTESNWHFGIYQRAWEKRANSDILHDLDESVGVKRFFQKICIWRQ